MAGIAGVLTGGKQDMVDQMLKTITHRGPYGKEMIEFAGITAGIVFSKHEEGGVREKLRRRIITDGPGFGQKAEIARLNGTWKLYRDELGVTPLYYTYTKENDLCFASEVKSLLPISEDIFEVPEGSFVTENGKTRHFSLAPKPPLNASPDKIAVGLLNLLTLTISRRISSDTMGAWLSGGLDSSTISVIARPWISNFHTFAGGLKGASDLDFAKMVAAHIGSKHHEIILDVDQMMKALPMVIYHLESFDPLLVRSSIVNFLVARYASGFVGEVFSGEGGDELFAGYHYLKNIPADQLEEELLDLMGNLHNTAFQRVDRCAGAHGLTAHVVFADPLLFEFVLGIPSHMKLKDGIEKWILRNSMQDLLPDRALWRPKEKFWEGAGVQTLLADYAMKNITDSDFHAEKRLPNGWILNSKEELMYYRFFKESFGELENLEWMGRTRSAEKHSS